MPRGVTPKERMKRSEITLAKNLKPSGRLNADDLKKASEKRKTMSRSEFKDRAILKKLDINPFPQEYLIKTLNPNSLRDRKGGAAKQTKTYGNKPTESVFQKLKRAQMLRKMSGK